MLNIVFFLDMVSPIVFAIPIIILLVAIACISFGILWLINYLRKQKEKK